jgi:hypothetical protein
MLYHGIFLFCCFVSLAVFPAQRRLKCPPSAFISGIRNDLSTLRSLQAEVAAFYVSGGMNLDSAIVGDTRLGHVSPVQETGVGRGLEEKPWRGDGPGHRDGVGAPGDEKARIW